MNKQDIYLWIKKIIDSCETLRQWQNCENLIDNFENISNTYYLTRKLHNFHLTKFYYINSFK